jgi:hypothetical protein
MRCKFSVPFALTTWFFVASTTVAQQAPQTDLPLSYDYIFASLAITELDTGGLEAGGSFTIAPNVHIFGGYQDWELSENVNRSILQIGTAYHWDIATNLDLLAGIALAKSELDFRGPAKIDDEGLILKAGIRGWITNELELSGEILLDDSLRSDMDSVIEVGGQYHASSQFSIGGRVRIDEDETTLFLGGRFYFRVGR